MASQNPYIVSARKYRPATFESVVGQRALTSTLKNAIKSNKLAQAYLFCGPRGVGKTSCARIFAKTINCMAPTADGEACGVCESCKAIERGNSFNLIELDAASNNSVDDIRNITDQVNVPPQDGKYRVFIIDEVHMLSNAAFNAFLKTLEEPPRNVVFILATTERHKVIPTILSRCQVYDFRRITVNDIIDHLSNVAQKEGVSAEREALEVIAMKADGAMRDALSIFDQVVASTHSNLTYQATLDALNSLDQEYYFRLVDIFRQGDVASALLTFKEITDKGFDPQFFINGLASHVRNLMVCADPRTVSLLETSEQLAQRYTAQAATLPVEWYYTAMKLLNDADFNYRLSGNKRLLVEITLIRLARLFQSSSPQPSPGTQAPQTPASQPPQAPFVKPEGNKPLSSPAHSYEAKKDSGKMQVNERSFSSSSGIQGKQSKISKPSSFRLSEQNLRVGHTDNQGDRKNNFSIEEFMAAWSDYPAMHPEQRILAAAMRGATPQKISDFTFKIEVEHPAQKQAFDSASVSLIEFLKDRLSNDYVILKVSLSDKKDEDKTMNSKEFLKMAIDNNSHLAKFLQDIDAELEV